LQVTGKFLLIGQQYPVASLRVSHAAGLSGVVAAAAVKRSRRTRKDLLLSRYTLILLR
jgi:hypothetical protein